jgi:hypothetical protein
MMAHGIGRLLLGAYSHSQEGLMSIPWDLRRLQRADRGQLVFTSKGVATIRAEALLRLGSQNWYL